MEAFLLSMQAAGLITSTFNYFNQSKLISLGKQLENAQFKTNLQAIRTQSAMQSRDAAIALRQNIGSQIAFNAAKGNRGSSSVIKQNESLANFGKDEQTRRLNLLSKEAELRANNVLSGLHTAQSESQLGQALSKDIFNTISPNSTKSLLDSTFNWGIK